MNHKKKFEKVNEDTIGAFNRASYLEEMVPDVESSYLSIIKDKLAIINCWLNDLLEEFEESEEELEPKPEINNTEDFIIEEDVEEIPMINLEAEDNEEGYEIIPIDEDLNLFYNMVNNLVIDYNDNLMSVMEHGLYVHPFLSNCINQHLRETLFYVEFEKERLNNYEGN